jgi:hypothetical protein
MIMNKTYLVIIPIVLIAIFVFGFYLSAPKTGYETAQYKEKNSIDFKIDSYTTIYDKDGNVKFYSEHPALLTTVGKDAIKGILGVGQTVANYTWIAVGGNTSAMAVGDTTLANEFSTCGLTRALGTYGSTGTGAWRIEKDFAVTGTCVSINSTALFNASSTGTLLAEDTISNTNVANGDTLNMTWTVSVS